MFPYRVLAAQSEALQTAAQDATTARAPEAAELVTPILAHLAANTAQVSNIRAAS